MSNQTTAERFEKIIKAYFTKFVNEQLVEFKYRRPSKAQTNGKINGSKFYLARNYHLD